MESECRQANPSYTPNMITDPKRRTVTGVNESRSPNYSWPTLPFNAGTIVLEDLTAQPRSSFAIL